MTQIGAHVSISDGFDTAVIQQQELGGTVGQVFVGSPRGWAVRDIDATDVDDFTTALENSTMGPWIVHGTYLINFATPKDDLAEKSIATVQAELDACSKLNIPFYVFHPGAHTGAGVKTGVENVGQRLTELTIPPDVTLLLENTAGKGTTVGKTFEQLDRMVALSDYTYDDIGICVDSCHLHAAGYDFRTDSDLESVINELEEVIGIEHVKYLHLNDSKHPLGSEKDEHEHIVEGEIGDEGFRNLINHPDLRDLPMVLETPEDEKGYAWNIDKIKSLSST